MTRSIRLRIALFVLATVGFLQLTLSVYVLERVERAQKREVDLLLQEELNEVEALLGRAELPAYIEAHGRSTKWNETFIEIRDSRGQLVASTSNVPEGGLQHAPDSPSKRGVRIWESVHPHSRKGHRHIRAAETTMNGHTIRVARSLRRQEKTWLQLRAQLAWGLLAMTALGGLTAWWVAARSLAPLRDLTDRARELQASLLGELPRSGRGDELDRLAEVLNELLGRIRTEVGRMRRMTADAAHALRTPLTAIRGNLELQLRDAGDSASEEIGISLEAIDELVHLVNRLLMLERIESGAQGTDGWTTLRFDLLVVEVTEALQVSAADRGLSLKCESETALVFGDRKQLRNAVANLLDNALRHTPEGGDVQARVQVVDERVVLSVCDTGVGLRPDQLEHVFERFYSSPGDGGTGLGLPIARAIAEAHGGSLTASSRMGKGARFDLELPRTLASTLLAG